MQHSNTGDRGIVPLMQSCKTDAKWQKMVQGIQDAAAWLQGLYWPNQQISNHVPTSG